MPVKFSLVKPCLQMHEPVLALGTANELQADFESSYSQLAGVGVPLNLVVYYDDVEEDVYSWLVRLPVQAISLDFCAVPGAAHGCATAATIARLGFPEVRTWDGFARLWVTTCFVEVGHASLFELGAGLDTGLWQPLITLHHNHPLTRLAGQAAGRRHRGRPQHLEGRWHCSGSPGRAPRKAWTQPGHRGAGEAWLGSETCEGKREAIEKYETVHQ